MTTKQEFSGSLEHAEVMFDALVGLDGRYRVIFGGTPRHWSLSIPLMMPPHRKSAFVKGQTFYSVGVRDAERGLWYWVEELVVVDQPALMYDSYGNYLDFGFASRGHIWRGNNPEMMEALAS